MLCKPMKPSWTERLTGLPAPWNRPALTLMTGGLIAMIAVFVSQWQSTHRLVTGLLIAVVWIAMGLTDVVRVLHREWRK